MSKDSLDYRTPREQTFTATLLIKFGVISPIEFTFLNLSFVEQVSLEFDVTCITSTLSTPKNCAEGYSYFLSTFLHSNNPFLGKGPP